MKYIIALVFILTTAFSCSDDFDSVNISTTTIGKGEFSYEDYDEENNYLIVTNTIHWDQLRAQVADASLTDSIIDFSNYTIIGCIDSVRPSGGFSIEISSVTEEEDEIEVTVQKSNSGAGAALTVITRPYHFVKVPKISKPVVFN